MSIRVPETFAVSAVVFLLLVIGCKGRESRPAMPIAISYRASVFQNGGYVMQFHNTSDRFLRIALVLNSSSEDRKCLTPRPV